MSATQNRLSSLWRAFCNWRNPEKLIIESLKSRNWTHNHEVKLYETAIQPGDIERVDFMRQKHGENAGIVVFKDDLVINSSFAKRFDIISAVEKPNKPADAQPEAPSLHNEL